MFSRLSMCCSLAFLLMHTFFQIVYGAWKISGPGGPYVSIFGGARFAQDDPYAHKAHALASMLVDANISVLTGGGPGIMEAASCGAVDPQATAKSIGISVKDLGEGRNPCVQIYIEMDHFFARKWLLTQYSSAFIVFPGGFGTLDEMAEVLTLIQTKQMKPVPIVLIGKEYWDPFMHWIKVEAIKHGTVSEKDVDLFTVTDDLDQAFCLVRDKCAVT